MASLAVVSGGAATGELPAVDDGHNAGAFETVDAAAFASYGLYSMTEPDEPPVKWAFETDDESGIQSTGPTIVDGTVYFGSRDDHVYALETGSEGSSVDSRVLLGTLGHHDVAISDDDPETQPGISIVDLSLSETNVDECDQVTITATVKNTGDVTGDYTAELEIDGDVEATETVSLDTESTKSRTTTPSSGS